MAQRHKRTSSSASEPGFGRMLAFSVLLHLLILVFVSGVLFNQRQKPERLSYKVNLINKPVAQPRQGRPDVLKQAEKPAPKPAVQEVKPEPKPEPVKKVTVPAAASEKAPLKKIKPEPEKAKEPAAPAPRVQPQRQMMSAAEIENLDNQDTQERIEEMRQRQKSRERIERLKQQLAAETRAQSPTTTVAAGRVGSVGGTGTQAGPGFNAWIKEHLMKNWTLPPTHRKEELYSVVELRFDPQGRRRFFRVVRSSGDRYFDQSVKKAVTTLDKLPNPPGKELSLSIKFDPEEKY